MAKDAASKNLDIQIGENIRRIRDCRKITREALADASDISVTHLSQLESGNKGTSHILLMRLAKVLEVEVGDFYPTALDQEEETDTAVKDFKMLIADCTKYEIEALMNMLKASKSNIKMVLKSAS